MKVLFLCIFFFGFNAFGAVRELPPIEMPKVITLDGDGYIERKKAAILQEKRKNEVEEFLKTLKNFEKVTTKKHDWKETLEEINNAIDEVKKLMKESKNAENVKKYDEILTKLTFYRGVVHLHLKYYGFAMLDMHYVIAKDESYFEKKPVMYFKQELNLDKVMTAVWKYLEKVDTYYCNLALNNNACSEAIDFCYSQKWTATCRDVQYPANPYNGKDMIDIETLLNYYHFNNPCQSYCLFADKDSINVPVFGVVAGDDKCEMYQTNKATRYLQQLTKYKRIGTSGKKVVQDYFCRAFTNIMLLGEGTTVANAVYIASAKADIQTAIEKNSTLSGEEKITELEDEFVIEIFNKYNQFVTKDMTAEQLALINSAVSQENLQALKAQMEDNIALVNESIEANNGIIGSITPEDSLRIENMPDVAELNNIGYGQNALQNITNIQGITMNPNLLEEEKKQMLLNGDRMTQLEAKGVEATLESMLKIIEELQATGDY